jgi:hypothetical protein
LFRYDVAELGYETRTDDMKVPLRSVFRRTILVAPMMKVDLPGRLANVPVIGLTEVLSITVADLSDRSCHPL